MLVVVQMIAWIQIDFSWFTQVSQYNMKGQDKPGSIWPIYYEFLHMNGIPIIFDLKWANVQSILQFRTLERCREVKVGKQTFLAIASCKAGARTFEPRQQVRYSFR